MHFIIITSCCSETHNEHTYATPISLTRQQLDLLFSELFGDLPGTVADMVPAGKPKSPENDGSKTTKTNNDKSD